MVTAVKDKYLAVALSVAAGVGVQGCDSLSDVGDQESQPPRAVAQVIGHSFRSASGVITTTVRAGGEVLLTGKDSEDPDGAIRSFTWRIVSDPSGQVVLKERNNHTVSFTAPRVGAQTDVTLRLTVTSSENETGTVEARVTVIPALDSGELLAYLGVPGKFRIVAATRSSLGASTAFPFDVTVRKRVRYKPRNAVNDAERREESIGRPITLSSAWLAGVGSTGCGTTLDPGCAVLSPAPASASAFNNPRFALPVPVFNADELNVLFQDAAPGSVEIGRRLDPDDIDTAELFLDIELRLPNNAALPTNVPVLHLLAADPDPRLVATIVGTSASQVIAVVEAESLLPAPNQTVRPGTLVESRATAEAYYSAIDPEGGKLSLRTWLGRNCFNPDAENFGADARATYTNNFDLGLGRDMFFKTQCRPGQARIANPDFQDGDVASVVVNYLSLEAAAKKLGPQLAVAMEFKRPADPGAAGSGTLARTAGDRIVTFYVFAPDDADPNRDMLRVLSANLDFRGERYVPGMCTVCHGGLPRSLPSSGVFPDSGNVNAAFMPFDQSSFLFADTDPSFSTKPFDASLRTALGSQNATLRAEFKKLNEAVLCTYRAPTVGTDPYGALRELVAGWHGGPGALSGGGGTDAAANLCGQLASTSFNANFVPPAWQGRMSLANPASPVTSDALYREVMAHQCRACHLQRFADRPDGPVFDTYENFQTFLILSGTSGTTQSVNNRVFTEGGMPAVPLSTDRMHVPFASSPQTPAALLADHVGVASPAVRPGLPQPRCGVQAVSQRGVAVRFDGTASAFADQFQWSLQSRPAGSSSVLVGPETAEPALLPDRAGDYVAELLATSVVGAAPALVCSTTVPNLLPAAGTINASTTFNINTSVGAAVTVNVLALPNERGDLPATVAYSNPVNLTFVQGAGGLVTLTPTSLTAGSLGYSITDTDGDAAAGTIQLAVQPAGSLITNDDSSSVVANSATPVVVNVLANDLTAGLPVTVTASPSGTCAGRLDTRATLTVNANNTISYQPPPALVTGAGYDGSTVGSNCTSFDTFNYTIQSPGLTPGTGTVRVQVFGTRFFSQVFNIMENGGSGASASCASCHSTSVPVGGGGIAVNWQVFANDATRTYNQLRMTVPPPVEPNPSPPYLDLQEVTSVGDTSLLLTKPQNLSGHGGLGIFSCTPTLSQACIIFRTWLEEGAYNN